MARNSMIQLIERIRLLIKDPVSASPMFSDDEIEATLDVNRTDMPPTELTPREQYGSGGVVLYKDYYAGIGAWEGDYVLQDSNWDTLTSETAELLIGVWHFAEHQDMPVYVSGKVYDLYATAADLLEMKLSKVSDQFDFSSAGASFSRSQQSRMIQALIDKYRAQTRPITASLVRSDTNASDLG
jgi:hypothetical protein